LNKRIYYHLLFWAAVYLLWIFVFRNYSFSVTKTMTVEFCYLIFITIDFYAVSYIIIPQFSVKRKYFLSIVAAVSLIAVSALLRALVAVQMNIHLFHVPPPAFGLLFLTSILNISIWVLLFAAGKMIIDRVQNQHQVELLEKEKTTNELAFLKAQINPHALFNSLNTIYGHIDKSNQLARNTLLQFSELLRYQLYDCTSEKVSLEKEMEYIKNYIAFQQLRKDEHLIVQFEVQNIEKSLTIAPLLLVVLIENAFKFVSNSSEKENKIIIRLSTESCVLHSYIFNTKEQQLVTATHSNGIGVANLKRRLELLYPEKFEFTINNEKDFYETNLIINLL
jgi:two-component system LytT family sensor kinase